MTDRHMLTVEVQSLTDSDVGETTELATRLRMELLDLDVIDVNWLPDSATPNNAKGLGSATKALVVWLGTIDGLRTVANAIRNWAKRTNRTVEVSLNGDMLKLTGVTSEQQEKIIDAWLARHATDV